MFSRKKQQHCYKQTDEERKQTLSPVQQGFDTPILFPVHHFTSCTRAPSHCPANPPSMLAALAHANISYSSEEAERRRTKEAQH